MVEESSSIEAPFNEALAQAKPLRNGRSRPCFPRGGPRRRSVQAVLASSSANRSVAGPTLSRNRFSAACTPGSPARSGRPRRRFNRLAAIHSARSGSPSQRCSTSKVPPLRCARSPYDEPTGKRDSLSGWPVEHEPCGPHVQPEQAREDLVGHLPGNMQPRLDPGCLRSTRPTVNLRNRRPQVRQQPSECRSA